MTAVDWALWIATGLAVWLLALAAVIPIGKRLHRGSHIQQTADPRDCPPWCVAERAAAILRNQHGGL